MWASEFDDSIPTQPARLCDPLDCLLGLVLQRLRLNTTRFVGYGVIVSQLS